MKYYDRFPLAYVFKRDRDGFYAANFHYLQYRTRLRIAQMEEKRLRKANEGRARNKNQIDILFKDMVEVKK